MSSLACRFAFYRPEQNIIQGGETMELNVEGFEMKKWKKTMDRTQKLDKKNGVICLVIMYTPGFVVIKMLQMAHSLYFLLMTAKNQSQLR